MNVDMAAVRNDLAPSGELQVAINLGNPVLAQRDAVTGRLGGVSVALANELAKELGIAVSLMPYDAAGKVFAALEEGVGIWRFWLSSLYERKRSASPVPM